MVSTGLPSREPDGGEYVDLVDFGVVASGGALPVLHSQVCLPPLLPVPNWLPHDAVETWHRRRIGHGRQAWRLLSWLLLGPHAAAVRGRCYEPPVDRGADGGRRRGEAATRKHLDYPGPRGLSGDGGHRSPHLVARRILGQATGKRLSAREWRRALPRRAGQGSGDRRKSARASIGASTSCQALVCDKPTERSSCDLSRLYSSSSGSCVMVQYSTRLKGVADTTRP